MGGFDVFLEKCKQIEGICLALKEKPTSMNDILDCSRIIDNKCDSFVSLTIEAVQGMFPQGSAVILNPNFNKPSFGFIDYKHSDGMGWQILLGKIPLHDPFSNNRVYANREHVLSMKPPGKGSVTVSDEQLLALNLIKMDVDLQWKNLEILCQNLLDVEATKKQG